MIQGLFIRAIRVIRDIRGYGLSFGCSRTKRGRAGFFVVALLPLSFGCGRAKRGRAGISVDLRHRHTLWSESNPMSHKTFCIGTEEILAARKEVDGWEQEADLARSGPSFRQRCLTLPHRSEFEITRTHCAA